MDRFDIACVVFEGDVRLLELQLISIDRLLDLSAVGTYWLIANGATEGFEVRLHGFVDKLGPTLREKIRIVPASSLTETKLNGWRGQQVLKLLISLQIKAKGYLVLDAKNHLIKPSNAENFFREGRALTLFERPSALMQKLLGPSLAYFGIAGDEAVANAMPTITPFFLYTDIVRALMAEVEKREGLPFPQAFLENLKELGEFFLYYAYLKSRVGVEARYIAGPTSCVTLFAKWPEETAVIDKVMGRVARPQVVMFGLHRLRLPLLSAEHRQQIAEIWSSAGIATLEESEYYLTPAA